MANNRIKDLATTKYKGFMALDDADGTGKMDVDTIFNNFAGKFKEDADYDAGDIVLNDGSLYMFKAQHSAGSWNASEAEKVSIGNILTFGSSNFTSGATTTSSPYTGKFIYFKCVAESRLKLSVSGIDASYLPTNTYYKLQVKAYDKAGTTISTLAGYYRDGVIPQELILNIPVDAAYIEIFYRSSTSAVFHFNLENPLLVVEDTIYEKFSTTKNYIVGNRVYKDNVLYEFCQNHSAGAWNTLHVKVVTIGEILDFVEQDIEGEEVVYNSFKIGGNPNFVKVLINKGETFTLKNTLHSGSATDVIYYANTTATADIIGYVGFSDSVTFTAKQKITKIIGYIRGNNSADITATLTTKSLASQVFEVAEIASEAKENSDYAVVDITKQTTTTTNNFSVDVNIRNGQSAEVTATLDSGVATDVLIYANTTATADLIGYVHFGEVFKFTATQAISSVKCYARGFDGATITLSVKALSAESSLNKRLENVEEVIAENIPQIPDYAKTMADAINTKLDALQNSMSASIAYLTDIHVAGSTFSDATQYAMDVSGKVINYINKSNPLNLAVLNGDYLYNGLSQTKADSLAWYKGFSHVPAGLEIDRFVGKGNHDVNDIAGTTGQELTDEELFQAILKFSKGIVTDYGYAEKAYGYYDIPNRKIRCIFVNTIDIPYILDGTTIRYKQQQSRGVSQEQLEFIASALQFEEEGWGVLFFSHHPLQGSDTFDDGVLTADHGGTQLLGIIDAYRNKTTYSSVVSTGDFQYDINVDYSANASDEVIAMICGHNHSDKDDVVDGILMVSAMAASFVYGSYDSEGNPVYRTAKTSTETSWDVVTIDRKEKKLYFTRYGAGDDRQFSY